MDIIANIDAEACVIGSALKQEGVFPLMRQLLPDAKMFYRAMHQDFWQAMCDIGDEAISSSAILAKCMERGVWAGDLRTEAEAYLSELDALLPSGFAGELAARIVREEYIRREMRIELKALLSRVEDPTVPTHVLPSQLEEISKTTLNSAVVAEVDKVALSKEFDHVVDVGGTDGLTTTFEDLDARMGGFVPGGLYIIAARPGQGKSALMLNMAERYIKAGSHVGFAALEMNAKQCLDRMVAARAGINSRKLRKGKLEAVEAKLAKETKNSLLPLWHVSDKPGQNIHDIQALCRAWHKNDGIPVLMVDYLQIVGALDESMERRLQIGQITRGLKLLAREQNIVVIAGCQLSREQEKRKSRPILADLKEAGNIEEDADGVLGIYRESSDMSASTWKIELGVMKNRHGEVGHISLDYDRACNRFVAISARDSVDAAFRDHRAGKDWKRVS